MMDPWLTMVASILVGVGVFGLCALIHGTLLTAQQWLRLRAARKDFECIMDGKMDKWRKAR